MTLIIAVGYPGGVIMACDSGSADSESHIKVSVDKILQLPNLSMLAGGSGDGGLIQKVLHELPKMDQKTDVIDIRRAAQKVVSPVLRQAMQAHVPIVGSQHQNPPTCTLLLAGALKDGTPWIVEVGPSAGDTEYGEKQGYFAAIGMGRAMAQAVVRVHQHTERDERTAKTLAYRVMEDAIDMSAVFLSRPIYVHRVTADGDITKLDQPELDGLKDTCDGWRQAERDALAGLYEDRADGEKMPEPATDGS